MTVAGEIMVMAVILSIILLFIGVGMLIFVHICIVGRAFRRGFGNLPAAEGGGATVISGGPGNTSMSKDDVEKLPCFDYITKETTSRSSSSISSPAEDCAVCLESFQTGEKCRLLPVCKHSFHAQCVDTWLLRTPFCPICRTGAGSSSHFSTDTSLELSRGGDDPQSQTTESSSRFSDIRVDIIDDHHQMGESQREGIEGGGNSSSQFSGDIGNNSSEFRENQAVMGITSTELSSSLSDIETEENQTSPTTLDLPPSMAPELAV